MSKARWTVLPPVELFGLATDHVESLEHYLQRLAWISGSDPRSLVELDESPILHSKLCGPGGRYTWAVERLSELTGRDDLHCGTLRNLNFLAEHAELGFSVKTRRWCPCCFENWDPDSSYEPLAWHVPHVVTCPIHGCTLERLCPSCGATQRQGAAYERRRLCRTCKESLGGPGRWLPRSLYDDWAEKQLRMLVAWCSDPRTAMADRNACADFLSEVLQSLAVDPDITESVRMGLDRVVWCGYRSACDLDTLLNLCALQGVDAVEVFRNPLAAASAPLSGMRSAYRPMNLAIESDREKLSMLEDIVARLTGEGGRTVLPSGWVLAEFLHLSWQHVRRHGSFVMTKYNGLIGRTVPKDMSRKQVDFSYRAIAAYVREQKIDLGVVFDPVWVADMVLPGANLSYGTKVSLVSGCYRVLRMMPSDSHCLARSRAPESFISKS